MAITIYVSQVAELSSQAEMPLLFLDHSLFIADDDGYYWFMYDFFLQLAQATSQLVDLYGYAVFEPNKILQLKATIQKIELAVTLQPEIFPVTIGKRAEPVKKDLIVQLERQPFLEFLHDLLDLADLAQREKLFLVFCGD